MRSHYAHIVSVTAFNLGDKLYRNHLSFTKELAPEIRRGVRVSYTVSFLRAGTKPREKGTPYFLRWAVIEVAQASD